MSDQPLSSKEVFNLYRKGLVSSDFVAAHFELGRRESSRLYLLKSIRRAKAIEVLILFSVVIFILLNMAVLFFASRSRLDWIAIPFLGVGLAGCIYNFSHRLSDYRRLSASVREEIVKDVMET